MTKYGASEYGWKTFRYDNCVNIFVNKQVTNKIKKECYSSHF